METQDYEDIQEQSDLDLAVAEVLEKLADDKIMTLEEACGTFSHKYNVNIVELTEYAEDLMSCMPDPCPHDGVDYQYSKGRS